MKTVVFGIIVVVVFLTSSHSKALACSCPSMGLPLEQEIKGRVKNGGAVFSGEVIEIVNETTDRNVTFQVGEFWKGGVTARFTIASDKTTSSCAFDFKIGKSYLIFANEWEGKLYTGACSYNRELDKADEYLKILGKGKTPKKIKVLQ